jgi:hypothetical protein
MIILMLAGWVIFVLSLGKEYCYESSKNYRYLIHIDRILLLIQLIQLVYIGHGFYEIFKPIYNRFQNRRQNQAYESSDDVDDQLAEVAWRQIMQIR